MDKLFRGIEGSRNWRKIEKIKKGWSSDEKFYVETALGNKLLLRISDKSTYENKKRDYEALKKVSKLEINVSNSVDIGMCEDGEKVYLILTWVEGVDAETNLSKLSPEKQYKLGVKAGKILKKIHGVTCADQKINWEKLFNSKIDRRIKRFNDCEIKFDNWHRVVEYIENNRSLLKDRPMAFQHGDYHIGNMVITKDEDLGIIDFNRADIGDPWEEFNRITWCSSISKYFASGRINGYFDGKVPHDFFRLLALYIGSDKLASIPWAIPYGEKDVDIMLSEIKKVMENYDNFRLVIPNWYMSSFEDKH